MFRLSELVEFLKEKKYLAREAALCGGASDIIGDIEIKRFASLAHPSRDALCWAKKPLAAEDVPEAAALLCLPEQEHNAYRATLMLHVEEPRRVFAEVVSHFYPEPHKSGISERAIVSPTAKIGKNVYIGAGAVIEDECVIGDGTIIDANVTIYRKVTIGKNCHISSGAVIGADGHGYALDENKRYQKIRHMGNVVIGDNVDIGANSCVNRGVLDDTFIGNGTKVGNLVNIAHNVIVGNDCMITPGAILTGSSTVCDRSWISSGAIINNSVFIASHNQIGMNSLVMRSINEENGVYVGAPARFLKEYKN